MDEWMDKGDVVCIHNGILFSHKKERNPPIWDNMDKPWGHYAKWNKSEKVNYSWPLNKAGFRGTDPTTKSKIHT